MVTVKRSLNVHWIKINLKLSIPPAMLSQGARCDSRAALVQAHSMYTLCWAEEERRVWGERKRKGRGLGIWYYSVMNYNAKISAPIQMQLQTPKTCYYFMPQPVGHIRMPLGCIVLDKLRYLSH